MKKYFFLLALLLVMMTSRGQVFLEGGVTYNTFKMDDMKELQEVLIGGVSFPMEPLDSFEPFVGFQLSGGKLFEMETIVLRVGGIGAYTSTGGRTGFKDYTGHVRGDQVLTMTSFGLLGGIEKRFTKWTLGFDLPVTLDVSKLTIETELVVYNQTLDEQSISFASQAVSITPRLNLWRNISEACEVGLTIGFQAPLNNGELKWTEDDESSLMLGDKVLKAEWSGLRAGIIFRFKIFP